MKMDIESLIKTAKLGRERKDAQTGTCVVFAAALFDVLAAQGIQCQMVTIVPINLNPWAHAVVEVDGRYFDSMGEFSVDIYRTRAKIHPGISVEFKYVPDVRPDCYEPEFDELHAFFLKELNKALCRLSAPMAA